MKKSLKRVFVKPAVEGQLVRKGLGQDYLLQEGEEVVLTAYWHRRIRMKDVIVVPKASKAIPKTVGESKDSKKGKIK